MVGGIFIEYLDKSQLLGSFGDEDRQAVFTMVTRSLFDVGVKIKRQNQWWNF